MASITLVYSTLYGNQLASLVNAAMAAVPLDQGELDLLGYTIDSDTTATNLDGTVTRTVVLGTTAASDALFPTDESRIYSTRGLFAGVIGQGMPGNVTSAEPVVAP